MDPNKDTTQNDLEAGALLVIPDMEKPSTSGQDGFIKPDKVSQEDGPQKNVVPEHFHDSIDSPRIEFSNISNRVEHIKHVLIGTDAATAGNYGLFWIAPAPCFLRKITEVHQTKGTDGSAVTLQIEKLTGTTAPGSGTVVLATALDLKGNNNTVQTQKLVPVRSSRTLQKGDRLALKKSGTLTALDTVLIMVEIEYI